MNTPYYSIEKLKQLQSKGRRERSVAFHDAMVHMSSSIKDFLTAGGKVSP
jgi:hypothetical protein